MKIVYKVKRGKVKETGKQINFESPAPKPQRKQLNRVDRGELRNILSQSLSKRDSSFRID